MIPSALEHLQEIAGDSGRAAVFLDYDGTLTPIVSQPEDAWLSDSMRQTLRELAARAPVVAILSGRDLDDVRRRVNIDSIVYGGSHGFDIAGPRGLRRQMATEFLPTLDLAEKELHEALDGISGARVERKRFSIAAHYRNVNENDLTKMEQAIGEVATRHPVSCGGSTAKKFTNCCRTLLGTKARLCSGCWKRWAWSPAQAGFVRFTSATIAPTKTHFARLNSAALAFS